MSNNNPTPTVPVVKTSFYEVNIPETNHGPRAIVKVPFGQSKRHAIKLGLHAYREAHGLPTSHTIMATAQRIPLILGTTVDSKSGTATLHGQPV